MAERRAGFALALRIRLSLSSRSTECAAVSMTSRTGAVQGPPNQSAGADSVEASHTNVNMAADAGLAKPGKSRPIRAITAAGAIVLFIIVSLVQRPGR